VLPLLSSSPADVVVAAAAESTAVSSPSPTALPLPTHLLLSSCAKEVSAFESLCVNQGGLLVRREWGVGGGDTMPLFFPTSVYLSLAQIWSVHVWWRRRDQCRSSFPWPNKQQHRRFVSQVEGSKKGHGWSILQGRGERERCCLSPARGEDIACCSTDSVVFLCWLRQTSSLNICHRRVSERILD
jgi:hypothetical protein